MNEEVVVNRSAVMKRGLFPGVGLLVVAAMLIAWVRTPSTPAPTLLVNFDVSGSQSRAEREQCCKVLNQTMDQVFPGGARVAVTAFDNKPRILFDAEVRDQQELIPTEMKLLKLSTPPGNSGTDMVPALESSLCEANKIGQ